jgi:hypothetical protein
MAMTFPTFNGKQVSMAQIEARSTFQQLHPTMQQRVRDLMLASEGKVGLGEGFRSMDTQKALFLSRYVVDANGSTFFEGQRWRKKDPKLATAAPPGRSMHELGLAADLTGDMKFIAKSGPQLGLKNFANVNKEPWHVQPIELPNSRQEYEKMGSPWAKKLEVVSFQPAPKPSGTAQVVTPPEVVPGETSDVVKQLQDVLIRLNLIKDSESNRDGHYGLPTQKIVKAFQQSKGLTVDGRVGPNTWKALLALDPVTATK